LVATQPVPEAVIVPVKATNHIYVQAGAFKVLENASRLKQNLARLGPVAVTSAVVNGATFYRVRVGPIGNVAQADAMLDRVVKAGVTKPRIIVD